MRCIFLAVACFVGLFVTSIRCRSAGEDHLGMVLVRRTVDSRYDPASAGFHSLLKSPLTRSYTVQPGDSWQKIVSSHFSVGPTAANELYENISSRIQLLMVFRPEKKLLRAKPCCCQTFHRYSGKPRLRTIRTTVFREYRRRGYKSTRSWVERPPRCRTSAEKLKPWFPNGAGCPSSKP